MVRGTDSDNSCADSRSDSSDSRADSDTEQKAEKQKAEADAEAEKKKTEADAEAELQKAAAAEAEKQKAIDAVRIGYNESVSICCADKNHVKIIVKGAMAIANEKLIGVSVMSGTR